MSILSRLLNAEAPSRAPPHVKQSRAAAMIALHSGGVARWTPRQPAALVRQGYETNAVGFRAVRLVAEAAASVGWVLRRQREELVGHPLQTLIARPNPLEAGQALLEALFTNLMLFGNAYVEAAIVEGSPRELYALRPDRMTLVPGPRGWPIAYDYTFAGSTVRYAVPPEGMAPILHLKLFNPLDDHYGFAPLSAAQVAVDIHNAASTWNKALLDNAARPSGALVYAGPDGAQLTDDQFERLKAELDESFQGARNAGRPLLLEGGLDWKSLSLSPKDMDFVEARAAAARDIALAFGVPPMLLGIPGDNTYSNYREANRAFWRQTVIPLVTRTQQSVAHWMAPAFGDDLTLDYDVDRIEALAEERASEWTRVDAASFLTQDEKREAVGYGVGRRSAVTLKYSPDQPRVAAGSSDGGRWKSGAANNRSPRSFRVDVAGGFSTTDEKLTVQRFVSQNCQGEIWRELPSQFSEMTIVDVLAAARGGDGAATKCIKILNQDRFRK